MGTLEQHLRQIDRLGVVHRAIAGKRGMSPDRAAAVEAVATDTGALEGMQSEGRTIAGGIRWLRGRYLCRRGPHRGNVFAVVDRRNAFKLGRKAANVSLDEESQPSSTASPIGPAAELRPGACPVER